MHCSLMCLVALLTATCTSTSGRVSPSRCSNHPVVVPFTASVSTTTTPVHSSVTGPTFSSTYSRSPSLTASASANPTAPLNPPQTHTAASAGVSPYPRRRRMGNRHATTNARAAKTSAYTSKPHPRSAAPIFPSEVLSLVFSAMITPVRMKRTVLATNVSISQKTCVAFSVSPVKKPRPNAPTDTPRMTTANTPLASASNSATKKHR